VIIALALCVLVVLAIIEFLGRPPSPVVDVLLETEPEELGPEGAAPQGPVDVVDVSEAPADTSDASAIDPQRSPLKSDA
jgi:hypothetical protein